MSAKGVRDISSLICYVVRKTKFNFASVAEQLLLGEGKTELRGYQLVPGEGKRC